MALRILSTERVARLPEPMGAPACALAGGTAFLVGPGIVRYTPGSSPVALVPSGRGVPIEPGFVVNGEGELVLYGGHPEGDEHGALAAVEHRNPSTGELVPGVAPLGLPEARRGLLAVPFRGASAVLFGGIPPLGSGPGGGKSSRSVWIHKIDHVRPLGLTIPIAGSYMQAGKVPGGVFLLGSDANASDLFATRDAEGRPEVRTATALMVPNRFGVAVAQETPESFFMVGGLGGPSMSARPDVWRFSAETGSEIIGNLAVEGEPYAVTHAAAFWIQSERALYIAGGTRHARAGLGRTVSASADVIRVVIGE